MAPGNGSSKLPARPTGSRPAEIPPWADALVRILDNAFVIPGIKVRIGLDAILGFIAPGAGDAASAVATTALLWVAFTLRVPRVVLLRMLMNVAIDALIGVIPFIGDAFDVAFRAGEKNLALVRKYAGNPGVKPTASDYVVLGVCLFCVLLLLALPVVTGLLLLELLARVSGG